MKKTLFIAVFCLAQLSSNAQLFKPLGLGIVAPMDLISKWYEPQMNVEGDILYVCTANGLYSKDLSDDGSPWQLAGFEGVPLQDYARSGSDVLALRHCYWEHTAFTLLSHDGGKSYEDITPEYLKGRGYAFLRLEQHPADPNTLLTWFQPYARAYLTKDFGRTWEKVSDNMPMYMGLKEFPREQMGFHPLDPGTIYTSGFVGDNQAAVSTSYDNGDSWQLHLQYTEWWFNTVYRMAFHPTDPNRWIAGGTSCTYRTNDNGQTWEMRYLPYEDAFRRQWKFAEYDNENPDTIYMATLMKHTVVSTKEEHLQENYLAVMCSTDGGETWNKPYEGLAATVTTPVGFLFDMKQYHDKLLLYTESDVYEISKADLLDATTPVYGIAAKTKTDALYDLTGRRLTDAPKKGLYIKGGKKYVSQ